MTNSSELIKKTQNFWLILVTLSWFWPKFVNLNPWLGYNRVNNFLDLVVSPGHLLVLLGTIIELFRLKQPYTVLSLSLLTISIWQINLANPSVEELARAVFTWANLSLWLSIWFRYQLWFKFFWPRIIMIVWLFYAVFEHLLLSNPYPVMLVWLIFQILAELKFTIAYTQNYSQPKQSVFYKLLPTTKSWLVTNSQRSRTKLNQLFIITNHVHKDFLLIKSKHFTKIQAYSNHSNDGIFDLSKTPSRPVNWQLKTWLVNLLEPIFLVKQQWLRFGVLVRSLITQIQFLQLSEVMLFLINLWLAQNLLFAGWQVVTGSSLGLSILGEPLVSLQTTIAAKQPIGDYYLVLLRGYGLMQHPNVLGFLGVMGLWLSLARSNSTTHCFSKLQFYLRIVSILIIILSFSRLAWLGGLFILLGKLVETKITATTNQLTIVIEFFKKTWLWLLGLAGLMAMVFFSRLAYAHSTDWIRLQEYVYFWSTYSQLPWSQKLFGIGLGQYPFYFRSYHSWLLAETYQPMHNLLASLFLELGIVFSGLLLVYLYLSNKLNKPRSNKY
jgi:hypothetical protein